MSRLHKAGGIRSWIPIFLIVCLAFSTVPARGANPSTRASSPAAGSNAGEPQIQAKSAVLIEARSGKVLLAEEPDLKLPIASVTKVMTMTLALEALHDQKVRLEDIVTGSTLAKSMGGTQIWLEEGEQMSFKDMLYAVAVGSANDCAVAVAEHLAGSMEGFVDQMNQKAAALGMKNTHYANPTGLDDDNNYSTAQDLAILARYAVTLPMFLQLSSTWDYYVRKDTPQEVWLTTFNKLLKQYPGYDGIKTGFTDKSKYCLASTAQRNGLRLIAVVLGAETPKARSSTVWKMLDYGFRLYEAVPVVKAGTNVGEFKVTRGAVEKVAVVVKEDLSVAVPRGTKVDYRKEVVLTKTLTAPLKKGAVVGKMLVKAQEQVLGEVALVAAADVARGSFGQLMIQTTRNLLRSLVSGKK